MTGVVVWPPLDEFPCSNTVSRVPLWKVRGHNRANEKARLLWPQDLVAEAVVLALMNTKTVSALPPLSGNMMVSPREGHRAHDLLGIPSLWFHPVLAVCSKEKRCRRRAENTLWNDFHHIHVPHSLVQIEG